MKTVTVFGASTPRPDSDAYRSAESVGRALGKAGFTVMTGGYFGTMEAVSKGAKAEGARVIGVTVKIFEGDGKRPGPNAFNDEVIQYDYLRDRLYHLVSRCDAAVALPGGIGTLSEVALTWSLLQVSEIKHMPFVLVGEKWGKLLSDFYGGGLYVAEHYMKLWEVAHTPEQVVSLIQNWKLP